LQLGLKKAHTKNVCAELLGFSDPRMTPFLSLQKWLIVFAAAHLFYIKRTMYIVRVTSVQSSPPPHCGGTTEIMSDNISLY